MSRTGLEINLLPLPMEVAVEGQLDLSGQRLVILIGQKASGRDQIAAEELQRHIERCGVQQVCVRSEMQDIPSDAFIFALGTLETNSFVAKAAERGLVRVSPAWPGPQGYQLCYFDDAAWAPQQGVLLAGSDAMGAYYAVKTLKQLLCPVSGTLYLPRVRITDRPALEERGIFIGGMGHVSQGHGACGEVAAWGLESWRQFIDQLSDLKLNLMVVTASNGRVWGERGRLWFPSEKYPALVDTDVRMVQEDLVGAIVQYGQQRGIDVSLNLSHIDHLRALAKVFPETRLDLRGKPGKHRTRSATPELRGLAVDTSHPMVHRVISDLHLELVERYQPPALSFWPSEEPWMSMDQVERQIELFAAIHRKARVLQPDIRFRMCTVPTFSGEGAYLLDLLPPDATIGMYSFAGTTSTYTLEGATFPSEFIHRLKSHGYRFCSITPWGRDTWDGFPGPVPTLIRENIQRSVDVGCDGTYGNVGDRPTAYAINLWTGAETAWNPRGRQLSECLEAWLAFEGASDPHGSAQGYVLLSQAARTIALLNEYHLGHFRSATLDEARAHLASIPEYIEPLSELENAVRSAEQAEEIGVAVENDWLQVQAALMACLGRTVRHIYQAIRLADGGESLQSPTLQEIRRQVRDEIAKARPLWEVVKEHNHLPPGQRLPFADYGDTITELVSQQR
jgi:hypothetical protein